MKTAWYQNNLIHLDTVEREKYQRLYEAGKKGDLSCPVCKKPVRLYLGIDSFPHFFHHMDKNAACKDPQPTSEEASLENSTQEEEINGFRLPQSRAISVSVAEPKQSFRPAQVVKIQRPFTQQKNGDADKHHTYLQGLEESGIHMDANQKEAVVHTEGPLLILAGAGSGKTRVLTARTAFMLAAENAVPNEIMLVTFTAKAAAEMKNRLISYPGMNAQKVNHLVSGTFHSIFYKILLFHQREQWSSENLLKKDWQREQILKEAGRNLSLDEKEFAYDLALQQIGFWKNTMKQPAEIIPENKWEETAVQLYRHYEEAKEKNHLFDFDDMLLGCHRFFTEHPHVLAQYQERFSHFLIDEFQDINKVQYEIIKMLSGRTKNICAVGDDDQSIYAFRGSDPTYLRKFTEDFTEAKKVILNQNYRSTHEIVETANLVISANKRRFQKEMKAQHSFDTCPALFYPYDEEEEATMILTDIQNKIENGAEPKDFAILFRTNTASRAIFERLTASSLPFKIDQGADSFYERFIVRAMLAYLRLALNEDDLEAIKAIVPSLFLKQSIVRDLQADSILNDCSLLESLARAKTGFAFQEQKLRRIAKNIRSLARLSPLQAIERVEKEFGFLDFVKKRGNEGNQLEKGSDDLRDLRVVAVHFKTIEEFIEHVDHMIAMNKEMKQLSKKLDNAIILSTIHRAKGLEYKYVYILGVVDGSLPHDYALDSYRNGNSEPIEEERRLLYVAITRAQEQLYLSVPEYRRMRKASPSRFLTKLKKEMRS